MEDVMARIYARLVLAGRTSLDDIPDNLKDKVKHHIDPWDGHTLWTPDECPQGWQLVE